MLDLAIDFPVESWFPRTWCAVRCTTCIGACLAVLLYFLLL